MHTHHRMLGLNLNPKLTTNTLTAGEQKHRKLYTYSKSSRPSGAKTQRYYCTLIPNIQSYYKKTNTRVCTCCIHNINKTTKHSGRRHLTLTFSTRITKHRYYEYTHTLETSRITNQTQIITSHSTFLRTTSSQQTQTAFNIYKYTTHIKTLHLQQHF